MLSLTDNLKIHLGKNKHLNLIRPSFKKKKTKRVEEKENAAFMTWKELRGGLFVCLRAA